MTSIASEQPRSAEAALQWTLARHGIMLPDAAAREAAAAVLSHRDEDASCSMAGPREHWEDPAFRAYVRQQLRRQLLDSILDQGKVPVAFPTESLRYVMSGPYQAVPASEAWDTVEITLRVGVRTASDNYETPLGAQSMTPPPGYAL